MAVLRFSCVGDVFQFYQLVLVRFLVLVGVTDDFHLAKIALR